MLLIPGVSQFAKGIQRTQRNVIVFLCVICGPLCSFCSIFQNSDFTNSVYPVCNTFAIKYL